MPHQIRLNRLQKALLGIVFLGVAHQACLAGGRKCVQDPSEITEVCMEWDLQQEPVLDQDFSVNFDEPADPANPDIELFTGNMGWAITSEKLATGGRGNVGRVSLDPAQPTDNFGVAFPSGVGSGVLNAGSIDLTAASWTGQSNVTGGTIWGDLAGDLTVVSAPGGGGGSLSLVIEGRSFGAITAPSVSNLTVAAQLAGSINIGRIEDGGRLDILNETLGAIEIDEVDENGSIILFGPFRGRWGLAS